MEKLKQVNKKTIALILVLAMIVAVFAGTSVLVRGTAASTIKTKDVTIRLDLKSGAWVSVATKTGKKVNYTGIAKNNYGWWRVKNGKVDFSATGIYENDYGWWRVKDGKVDFKANGLYKNDYGWWYCKNGKVDFSYYGIATNEYGVWYVTEGKVEFSYSIPDYLSELGQKDTDKDGLSNAFETQISHTNPLSADTDKDGMSDYEEVMVTGTAPLVYNKSDRTGDLDGDGISNYDEVKKYNTNPLSADSDGDGISDYDEIFKYKTIPVETDTDQDGASDGWEIENGFDPLVPNETFDVTKSYSSGDVVASVSLETAGKQVESLSIKPSTEVLLTENVPGAIGEAVDLSIDGAFEEATLSFELPESIVQDTSVVPTIYYYNEETQMLEEMPTNVEGKVVSTTLAHFSNYVLLNKTEFDKIWEKDIRKPNEEIVEKGISISFVIDHSYSMSWNDSNGLRKSLTEDFINKLDEDKDEGSVISFIARAEVLTDLTNDKQTLLNAVRNISDNNGYGSYAGTNGSAGIYEAINQLKNDTSENTKYIIFMTDGEDTRTSYSYDDLISEAVKNDITIYSIGLGTANETLLKKIAEETGGKYYYASAAEDLEDAFDIARSETIDYRSDANDDGISDYYTKLLCDGTLRTGTGIPLFSEVPYSTVQSNSDYDGDGLKNGQEVEVEEHNGRVYLFVHSSPIKADTEDDGIPDAKDDAPLKKGYADGRIGELTIVACKPEEDSGHAWLTYKSYVNDNILVSVLYGGFFFNASTHQFDYSNQSTYYPMSPNCYMNIGNAGTQGASGAMSTVVGSCGGILFNREFQGAYENRNQYHDVVAYTRTITQEQLDDVIDYCSRNNYYNLYSHNCSTVALGAWESAFGNVDGFSTKGGSGVIYLFDSPDGLKKSILKKDNVDMDYQSTMLAILDNWTK